MTTLSLPLTGKERGVGYVFDIFICYQSPGY